jgi:ribosomal subunit interface protein
LHVYLTARHLELTDALRAYAESHLVQPIREHNGLTIVSLQTQLFPDGEKGNHFGCHVLVAVKGHHDLNVREVQDDIYAAINVAKDRVLRQLTELRDKMLTVSRHPKKYSFSKLGRALGWIQRHRARG